jgi:hypothetical protein
MYDMDWIIAMGKARMDKGRKKEVGCKMDEGVGRKDDGVGGVRGREE